MEFAFGRTVGRLETVATGFSERLNRRKAVLLTVFSAAYFFSAVYFAHSRPLWFDELYTYYISSQPTFQDEWAALTTIDNQPPLFFWITTAASHLVSDPQISVRIPEIFGFWLLSICLFLYSARLTSALWGIVAVASLFLTPAYHYSHEARPYALVTGCVALALFCWQKATNGSRISMVGLALSLACAISLSYYAVLAVAPIAFAELTRSIWKRSVNWAIWAALLCGSAVAFLYVPLVRQSVRNFPAANWASPRPSTIWEIYSDLAGRLFLIGVFIVLAAAAKRILVPQRYELEKREPELAAPWEIVAVIGFSLLPFLGVLVAMLVTKMIHLRYVLSTVIGLAVLIAWGLFRRSSSNALSAIVVAFLITGAAVPARLQEFGEETRGARAIQSAVPRLLANLPGQIPIVVDDPHRCLELHQYQKPEISSRLVFLLDDAASLRFGSTPYLETREWLAMKNFIPVRAEKMDVFRRRTTEYLVLSTGSPYAYVLPKLVADGERVRLVATLGNNSLFLVDERV